MKIEVPDIVVFLVLFFSVLYFYLMGFGEVTYTTTPLPIKKRKPVSVYEETITDFPLDIELPENMEEEFETETNDMEVEVEVEAEVKEEAFNMDSIKKEIESTCNFATAKEGLDALENPSEIINRLQTGFDMWEERTNQKGMTYSQLREFFG